MKKIIFTIVVFLSFLVNVHAVDHDSLVCNYNFGGNEMNITFEHLNDTTSLRTINYKPKSGGTSIFSYTYEDSSAEQHFKNYRQYLMKDNKEVEMAAKTYLDRNWANAKSKNKLNSLCPKKVILTNVDGEYDIYACGYNDTDCNKTIVYTQNMISTKRNDGIDAKSYTLTYNASLNGTANHTNPSDIKINDVHSKAEDNVKLYCNDNGTQYNKEKCDEAKENLEAISGIGEEIGISKEEINNYFGFKSNIDIDLTVGDNCDSYLGDPSNKDHPAYYLQFAFNLMKYAAILLLFGLTIFEFAKAMTSNKQDAMPKALINSLKRLIIAIIIFFLPILIEYLLELFDIYGDCNIR